MFGWSRYSVYVLGLNIEVSTFLHARGFPECLASGLDIAPYSVLPNRYRRLRSYRSHHKRYSHLPSAASTSPAPFLIPRKRGGTPSRPSNHHRWRFVSLTLTRFLCAGTLDWRREDQRTRRWAVISRRPAQVPRRPPLYPLFPSAPPSPSLSCHPLVSRFPVF
jgi:hypothetical protein